MINDLKFAYTAIGSLPHKDMDNAFDDMLGCFSKLPFLPQLANVNKFENMTFQCLENLACLKKQNGKIFLEKDLNKIQNVSDNLEDYYISFYSALDPFLKYLKKYSPKYAKAQITGPFTLSMVLKDINNNFIFYDKDLRNLIVKHLFYKALWLASQIKKTNVKPVIFIDEPSISMIGPYSDIKRQDVIDMLSEIIRILNQNDIITGIHCCGKCDWSIIIDSGAKILSFDAFSHAKAFAEYSDKINNFINSGGIICWGIIPTLSEEILDKFTLDSAFIGYYLCVNYLSEKGLNKEKIYNASMLSPSCGMGNLSVELSKKAMLLTKDLSLRLKEIKI